MKYQDYRLENSFYEQLKDISSEWEKYDMVGTLSYSSYKKINLSKVNDIIVNKLYTQKIKLNYSKS